MKATLEIERVGVVRSCFGEKFGTPRQPGLCPSAWGELVYDEAFRREEMVREGIGPMPRHKAVIDEVHHFDWHATLLHAFGLDHNKLNYKRNGLAASLTDNQGAKVVSQLLA